MKIKTGKGSIPLVVLLAVWSVSAIASLPGLAVSPILGDLNKVFPKVTDLEIQMLTSLPSLLIIPFVLLSGKLSEGRDKLTILTVGLSIFFLSGVVCLFARSMTWRHQLYPRHRGRDGHSPVHGPRRRLFHGRLPRPAVGLQLGDQQPDARCGHRGHGLSGRCRLAPPLSGLHAAGHLAGALVLPQTAAFGARTRAEHPVASQTYRPP